jgi:hypothetical protein
MADDSDPERHDDAGHRGAPTMPTPRKQTPPSPLVIEIDAVCQSLRAALAAARGARRVSEPEIVAAVLRASRTWCASADIHLERALAAAATRENA